jgi:hypothetical protein
MLLLSADRSKSAPGEYMTAEVSGAIVGWKRVGFGRSTVFEFQIAQSGEDYRARRFVKANLSLNDRRLASLIRDPNRAADGADIRAKTSKRKPIIAS